MPKKKQCVWNGIEYESVAACAESNGVSDSGMQKRLQRGYACDDDLSKAYNGISMSWNGISYESISQCARANGVTSVVMRWRLQQGWTNDEDIPPPSAFGNTAIPCEWEGVQYKSLNEAARANGVALSYMWAWVREKGYTCFDDMKPYVWEGVRYRTVKETARKTGISHNYLRRCPIFAYS